MIQIPQLSYLLLYMEAADISQIYTKRTAPTWQFYIQYLPRHKIKYLVFMIFQETIIDLLWREIMSAYYLKNILGSIATLFYL